MSPYPITFVRYFCAFRLAIFSLSCASCSEFIESDQSNQIKTPIFDRNVTPPKGDLEDSATLPQFKRFEGFDLSSPNAYGTRGFLPPNAELAEAYSDLTENQRKGLAAWLLFAADRGDFWRTLQLRITNGNNILRLVDSRRHQTRFEETGIINDPDCTPASTPDQFGLYIADCPRDPYSSGVIGLRLIPNPDFNLEAWLALGNGDPKLAAETWLRKPADRWEWTSKAYKDVIAVEPPYETAMACSVCHAAPNPLKPPKDPNNAAWNEIVFGLGNQFLQESKAFIDGTPDDDFVRHIVDAQEPGTVDTSRIATDHVFNPTAINAIFNLKHRPLYKERVPMFDERGEYIYNPDIKKETCNGVDCEVDTYRVLADGADSSGVSGALKRVFVNVGACYSQFRANMDPVWGVKHPNPKHNGFQSPISRRTLETECGDYQRLEPFVEPLADFLKSIKPYRLKAADSGQKYLKPLHDPQVIRGAEVFAEQCATCHSSIQPEFEESHGVPSRADSLWDAAFAKLSLGDQQKHLYDAERISWFKSQIMPDGAIDEDFLEKNFLSDDRRYPVSLVGTNAARALGGNTQKGGVWEEYGSVDYRGMPPVNVPLFNQTSPFKYKGSIQTNKGGYYRTPSLWGIWATAPYLHNNSVGEYNGGTSVGDRLRAFEDGMRNLLSDNRKPKIHLLSNRWVYLTTLPIDSGAQTTGGVNLLRGGIPIPPKTPIAIIGNLELNIMLLTQWGNIWQLILREGIAGVFTQLSQDAITVFDPVENRGHTFGAKLPEEDKEALMEFLKHL